MDDRNRDPGAEESLKKNLDAWAIGPPSDALEARLLKAFRSRVGESRAGQPWLRRSVSIPMPLFIGLVAALVVSTGFAVLGARPRVPAAAQKPAGGADPSTRSVSLVGFEPVLEPKLTVLRPGEQR